MDTKGAYWFQSLGLSREKKFGLIGVEGWFSLRERDFIEKMRERVKENYRDITIYLPDGMAYAFETVYVLNEWVWPFEFLSFKVPETE